MYYIIEKVTNKVMSHFFTINRAYQEMNKLNAVYGDKYTVRKI